MRYFFLRAIFMTIVLLGAASTWGLTGSMARAGSPAVPEDHATGVNFVESLPEAQSRMQLDDRRYPKLYIIWDFLQISFSQHLWLENTEDPSAAVRAIFEARELAKKQESGLDFFDRYIYPDKGYPKLDAINKWTSKEITVGIGWPLDPNPFKHEDTSQESRQRLVKLALPIIADIKNKTGLNIRFIDPDDPIEKTENFAKIRILPITETGLHNKYKSFIADTSQMRHTPLTKLGLLMGAVEFTPTQKSQVDGFFVPNHGNSIELAVCRIVPKTSTEMLSALVTECLLRSLGLPSESTYKAFARDYRPFLSPWNDAEKDNSKTLLEDGERALSYTINDKPMIWGEERIPKRTAEFALKGKITEYDSMMLSLLYCPEITPGMDRLEAMRVLLSTASCNVNITNYVWE